MSSELKDSLKETLERAEALLIGQREVFALMATDAPMSKVLEKLILVIEKISRGMKGSILLLDEEGKHLVHGAAPSLPESYNQAVNGTAIGPKAGSCGTAAYLKKQVIVTDILTDPLWADYQDLALQSKLRACWSRPVFEEDGKVLGTFAMYYHDSRSPTEVELELIKNVTQIVAVILKQIRIQEAHKKSISLLQATLEATADGILAVNLVGKIIKFNENFARMWRIPISVLSRQNDEGAIQMVLDQLKDPEYFKERVNSIYSEPHSESFDVLEFKDGRIFERHSKPQKIEGQIIGRVWSFKDVTERKQLEMRLRDGEKRFHFLADASVFLSESLDARVCMEKLAHLLVRDLCDWCIVILSDHYRLSVYEHIDTSKNHLLRKLEGFYPDFSAPVCAPQAIRTGKPVVCCHITDEMLEFNAERWPALATKNPEYVSLIQEIGIQAYMAVPLIARGRVLGAMICISSTNPVRFQQVEIAVAQDLGYRAALALDDAHLYAESQKAVRLREEFLSVASHELKTPITSLKLQVELLRRLLLDKNIPANPLTQSLAKVIQSSERQLDSITHLISELLDASKIESGRFSLHTETIALVKLVRGVLERYSDRIAESGCKVILLAESEVYGKWDFVRLEQVVLNLISNAMKYGAGKPIEISILEKGDFAIIAVKDHGIGVAEEDQKRIFQRFERAVSAQAFSGFGLGLFISSQIVQAHGGTIRVESELSKGATFIVKLPNQRVENKSK